MKDNNSIFVHESSFVDSEVLIGDGTKVWHFSHIMKDAIIGKNCIIGQNVFIGSNVVVGNNVKIQNNVSLYNGVICEDNVFIGPSCVFTNVINPRSFIERKNEFIKTILRNSSSIGANATIICGNELGSYSFIGAGSVVTKNVSDYELVVGNPAKHLYWIGESGSKLIFNEENLALCPLTNSTYLLKDKKVSKLL